MTLTRIVVAALAVGAVAMPVWHGREVGVGASVQQKAPGAPRGNAMHDVATEKDAIGILLEVEIYAMGGVGFAGTTSEGELALGKILESPGAASILRDLLERAGPAGQLYALNGLATADPATFRAEIGRFTSGELAERQVQTMVGCVISAERFGDVARRVGN